MVWVPRYIKQTIAKRPGQIVSSEDWNDLFNLLIGQGDYTAEGLLTAVTTFTNNLTAKADLVSGKIPLEQIPEIFKPTGLEALITTVNNLAVAVDGIEDYVLPTASTTVLGGIKVDGTSITVDENGVASSVGLTENDVFAVCNEGVTTLPSLRTVSIWSMGKAYIPASVTSMGDNWFYNSLVRLITGGGNLTTAGNSLAYNCPTLTSLSLPALTTAGAAFAQDCPTLTSLSLPALTPAGNSLAYNCPLTHLVVGGANTLTLESATSTAWKLPVADMVAFGTALKPAATTTTLAFGATYWNALSAAQKAIFTSKNYTITTQ